eukprot:CAMPEP_0175468740 /NCGR_PEP_ID=MMETSP0095-20121207/71982_1 /TAXON_ID=311494 /ORGANISM="Alexandrium monilatum, Strain CCMP3105" /LENGTH=30 /DNA_ID= /DNA_START= /DNA_END= /DNA_ORIENTATION=
MGVAVRPPQAAAARCTARAACSRLSSARLE